MQFEDTSTSSRQHLVDAVDKSLKRLGTDHIDLFQLHGQDYNTPLEETLATLDHLVRAGKTRYPRLTRRGDTAGRAFRPHLSWSRVFRG